MGLEEWPRFLLSAFPPTLLGAVCFPLSLSQVITPPSLTPCGRPPSIDLSAPQAYSRATRMPWMVRGSWDTPCSVILSIRLCSGPVHCTTDTHRLPLRSPAAAPLRTLPEAVKTDPAPHLLLTSAWLPAPVVSSAPCLRSPGEPREATTGIPRETGPEREIVLHLRCFSCSPSSESHLGCVLGPRQQVTGVCVSVLGSEGAEKYHEQQEGLRSKVCEPGLQHLISVSQVLCPQSPTPTPSLRSPSCPPSVLSQEDPSEWGSETQIRPQLSSFCSLPFPSFPFSPCRLLVPAPS